MPPIFTKETSSQLNHICEEYFLDKCQRDLFNIGFIHQVLWRDVRPRSFILHHHTGSRCERQLLMLPSGGKSDVNFKFDVESDSSGIYFKPTSDCSHARNSYGIVFVSAITKAFLLTHQQYKSVFRESFTPAFDTPEDEFVLLPNVFKDNVVLECGLDMTRGSQKSSSPSISGLGAKNETDAVPCLKLTDWTKEAELWVIREPTNELLCRDWKQTIRKTVSLYIVPTGNRSSQKCDLEWRLSFVFVEKNCFDRIDKCNPRIRRLFGLAKFVF